MKRFLTKEVIYLTFLTHNDSYMEEVPINSIVYYDGTNVIYNDKISVDYFEYVEDYLVK